MNFILLTAVTLITFNYAFGQTYSKENLECIDSAKSVTLTINQEKLLFKAEGAASLKLKDSENNFLMLSIENQSEKFVVTLLDLDSASPYQFELDLKAFAQEYSSLNLIKLGEPGLKQSEISLTCE